MSKVILITGAGSGFGRDTAETLARSGARVFASMREPAGRNRAAAEALGQQGVEVVEIDVGDDASVEHGVARVLSRAGRIDVLVNNAGVASAGVTEAFTADQAKLVLNTNVVGVIRATRAVLPGMRARREGLIVNVGSILGRVTFPFFGIYGASKFALEALSDSYRWELSGLGIEVALVQPGAYPTNMYASVLQPADPGRATGYGAIGEIPGRMFAGFLESFRGPDAPDPREVATAIADLIRLPRGARPARTVVGQGHGADQVNAQTALVQTRVLEGLGLDSLAGPPIVAEPA